MPTILEALQANGNMPAIQLCPKQMDTKALFERYEKLLDEHDWGYLGKGASAIARGLAERYAINRTIDEILQRSTDMTKTREDLLRAWITHSPRQPPQEVYKGLGGKTVARIRREVCRRRTNGR